MLVTVTVGGADDRAYPDTILDDYHQQSKKLLMVQFGTAMPLQSYRGSNIILARRQEFFNANLLGELAGQSWEIEMATLGNLKEQEQLTK